jgi:hypothetical protein
LNEYERQLVQQFDDYRVTYVREHGPLTPEDEASFTKLKVEVIPALSRIRAREDDKGEGSDGARSAQMLRDVRTLVVAMQRIRGTKPDKEYEKGLGAIDTLADLLDPDRRTIALIRLAVRGDAPDTPKLGDDFLERFGAMSAKERASVEYVLRVIESEDAFGVVVRGHVLLETALDSCIYSYVPNPMDLFGKLELFFSKKVRLAVMLGIISSDEAMLLKTLNTLRNDLAHAKRRFPDVSPPDFKLTWKREKEIWSEFIRNKAVKGEWPEYDKEKFPKYLRYIYIRVYLLLAQRESLLKERRLTSICAEGQQSDEEKAVASLLTVVISRVMAGMAGAIRDTSQASAPGGTDPKEQRQ